MVNGTLLNIGKRYEDNLRVIFDQWSKLPFNFRADLDFTSRPWTKTNVNVRANCMEGEERSVDVWSPNVPQSTEMTEHVVAAAVTRGDVVKENLDGNGSLVA